LQGTNTSVATLHLYGVSAVRLLYCPPPVLNVIATNKQLKLLKKKENPVTNVSITNIMVHFKEFFWESPH